MLALVRCGPEPGAYEVQAVPEPRPRPTDVLLEVRAAGICGSDLETFRRQVDPARFTPRIPGHEFCGVVAEAGAEVRGFAAGDRVVSETAAEVCGVCALCRSGDYNLCPQRRGFGFGVDGAFTRYVRVPERCLHRIPDGVPFEQAAMTEPLCVAYNALAVKSRIRPGDTVAVIGCGPIGQMAAQVAKAHGATVVMSGLAQDVERLSAATHAGVDRVVNAETEDLAQIVRDLTGGTGADLVADAVGGSAATLKVGLDAVRRNGQITKIGWFHAPLGYSLDALLSKQITLQGCFSHTWSTWERCLLLMAQGKVNLAPLATHRLPLTQWREGYRLQEERVAVKTVLFPDEPSASGP